MYNKTTRETLTKHFRSEDGWNGRDIVEGVASLCSMFGGAALVATAAASQVNPLLMFPGFAAIVGEEVIADTIGDAYDYLTHRAPG